jgi:hypothetical protein
VRQFDSEVLEQLALLNNAHRGLELHGIFAQRIETLFVTAFNGIH